MSLSWNSTEKKSALGEIQTVTRASAGDQAEPEGGEVGNEASLEGNAAPDAECWGIQQLTGQPGNHEQPTGIKADELVS